MLIAGLCLMISAAIGESTPQSAVPDNEVVSRLFREDQSDRQPRDGQMMEGSLLRQRDEARRAKLMEIYTADGLTTGTDYFHAAFLMQHGGDTASYQLAHEFSLAALALGHEHAGWIAAATYDRMLRSLGRPQRFGTQFQADRQGGPLTLYATDGEVRDSLRTALKMPSLATSKASAAVMAQQLTHPFRPILSVGRFAPGKVPPGLDVIDEAAGDRAPEALNQPDADYPEVLLPEKPSGSAVVSCIIERDGTASQIRVVNAGHPAFAAAAEFAVRKWTFKPALKQGESARVMVFIQFRFEPPTGTGRDGH